MFVPQSVPGKPWMAEFAQAPATLLFDNFLRVYFSCRPKADAEGRYISHCAYVDLDRGNLFRVIDVSDRPILPLGAPGTFDEFGTSAVTVLRASGALWAFYGG